MNEVLDNLKAGVDLLDGYHTSRLYMERKYYMDNGMSMRTGVG